MREIPDPPTASLLQASSPPTASLLQAGDQIAAAARAWIGTPFHWEASLKGVGADCRGLIAGAARDCGRPEADAIEAQVVGYSRFIDETALLAGLDRVFQRRPSPCEPEPGDVLAFRIQHKVQHLAICSAAGRMIHAYAGDPAQVVQVPLGSFWRGRLAGVWSWRP